MRYTNLHIGQLDPYFSIQAQGPTNYYSINTSPYVDPTAYDAVPWPTITRSRYLSIMDWPTTRPNGMEFILAASLDQCSLSERQIDAMANEGYLTLTDFSLNRYSDIDMVAKKLGQ